MTSRYLGAAEVAELTGMSKSYAFKLIQRLNFELQDQGIHHPRQGGDRVL